MSRQEGATYRLEEGISPLRDGAEGIFSHVGGYDALGPERRSLAKDCVRDTVIERPVMTLALAAGVAGLAGVFIRRLG
ncbi:hypothetical protein OQ496_01680 [Acetobacter suratthaniensis]|uniref:DUF883 domain-containing protein n=1 Tax=Acetobacter suratthaniensis TaxID=1502841 RepID=A0ABS3LKY3_9PROT|nr:hypothetical protein [Acetobacter suratthaniensis]MBO1327226.1 hypothetical protein [Acetobacter suratthaniensis]MCX2565162.1 hypothetical protein [Acetobacter suratthaniensis]